MRQASFEDDGGEDKKVASGTAEARLQAANLYAREGETAIEVTWITTLTTRQESGACAREFRLTTHVTWEKRSVVSCARRLNNTGRTASHTHTSGCCATVCVRAIAGAWSLSECAKECKEVLKFVSDALEAAREAVKNTRAAINGEGLEGSDDGHPHRTPGSFTTHTHTSHRGPPDKMCDCVSDAVLDACLKQDRYALTSVNTVCTPNGLVMSWGTVMKRFQYPPEPDVHVGYAEVMRQTLREIGYDSGAKGLDYTCVRIVADIKHNVDYVGDVEFSGNRKDGDSGIRRIIKSSTTGTADKKLTKKEERDRGDVRRPEVGRLRPGRQMRTRRATLLMTLNTTLTEYRKRYLDIVDNIRTNELQIALGTIKRQRLFYCT
ncbi:unnamed protein product [Vitrella brassicaformis CCMP3155]|uniref:S-adenosylmethionine synthetase N-terminal domain-containing protein n=1 Tax=Vitrella brassicaformis (strain CCMP3155) TaxID=1169540 RepID=A0A0G4FI53_VITBC|nr:unnamed protein product [Vitrella brassicaformis CCMP3155]|eukprot:CEM13138.1 unnamed protein product [Vitrella brassicaformis CCMP3155]